ncbi:hypothetical protein V8C86DRAFT_2458051 [Haematococcus lacustris]
MPAQATASLSIPTWGIKGMAVACSGHTPALSASPSLLTGALSLIRLQVVPQPARDTGQAAEPRTPAHVHSAFNTLHSSIPHAALPSPPGTPRPPCKRDKLQQSAKSSASCRPGSWQMARNSSSCSPHAEWAAAAASWAPGPGSSQPWRGTPAEVGPAPGSPRGLSRGSAPTSRWTPHTSDSTPTAAARTLPGPGPGSGSGSGLGSAVSCSPGCPAGLATCALHWAIGAPGGEWGSSGEVGGWGAVTSLPDITPGCPSSAPSSSSWTPSHTVDAEACLPGAPSSPPPWARPCTSWPRAGGAGWKLAGSC